MHMRFGLVLRRLGVQDNGAMVKWSAVSFVFMLNQTAKRVKLSIVYIKACDINTDRFDEKKAISLGIVPLLYHMLLVCWT